MVDRALRHHKARLQGKEGPDPYLKIWDAQSQLSAALSWDTGSAELWLEAGNLTFTLAGLMRAIQEGDILQDCLNYWARALQLESSAPSGGARPLFARLREWLQQLTKTPAPEMKKNIMPRVWLEVREDAWAAVQKWKDGPPSRDVTQRRMGRLEKQVAVSAALAEGDGAGACSAADGAGGCAASPAGGAAGKVLDEGWLGSALAGGKQLVFPTTIYRANLKQHLGQQFWETLSTLAANKYSEFSRAKRRQHRDITEYSINNAFFGFQETHEHALATPRAVKKWPQMYGSEEYKTLLRLARNASLAYFKHSGIEVGADELKRSWIIMWSAVYPQDPSLDGRHGWHTHQESILSGVFYANPQSTPLLFADPRGAPPIEDYEQYKANDLLFEPKAPFDAPYQMHADMGDLVVFPSWLVHKVPPPLHGTGSDHRVVFPFNFHLGTGGSGRGTVWDGWERTVSVTS